MLQMVKDLLKQSAIAQRTYRRYVRPHMLQDEPETYILRDMRFDQCLDVGANLGTYSILLSRNCDRVYAFEPAPISFESLQILNIKNVVAYNLALGGESGEMEIALPVIDGKVDHALATLRPLAGSEFENVEKHKVKVAKFDDFATKIDFNRIDFVKIDVEGFEMQALRGMSRLLKLKKPDLMIEIEQRHNPDYLDVFDFLRELGYESFVTIDGRTLQRLDVAELPKLQTAERLKKDEARKFRPGEHKSYINNIFFLRPDRISHYPLTQILLFSDRAR
jgi:FkbM family methyltransferase